MKKKVIIGSVVTIIVFIVLCFIFNMIFNNEMIIDYTVFSDDEVYYQKFSKLFNPNTSDYTFESENTEKRLCITIIDSNLDVVPEGKITFYDEEGYLILEKQANKDGKVAISNFEYDTTYYFKQTGTREDLVSDDTMYKIVIEEGDTSFYTTIVNDNKLLSDEEEDKLIDEYNKEKNKNEVVDTNDKKTYLLYSDKVNEEKKSVFFDEQTYILLKDDLEGLKLYFSVGTVKYDDDGNAKVECAVRLSNAYIKKYTIEKLYDESNAVNIVDLDNNITSKFEDGENFYLKFDDDKYTADELYKFDIVFEYNDKTYKISKTVDLNAYSVAKGRIESKFYSPEDKDKVWVSGKVKLESLRGNTDEIKDFIGCVRTGIDGMITYYNVPKGRYKLTKIQNKEDVESKIIEVKAGEIIEVEF